jgi:hypothetical protein
MDHQGLLATVGEKQPAGLARRERPTIPIFDPECKPRAARPMHVPRQDAQISAMSWNPPLPRLIASSRHIVH